MAVYTTQSAAHQDSSVRCMDITYCSWRPIGLGCYTVREPATCNAAASASANAHQPTQAAKVQRTHVRTTPSADLPATTRGSFSLLRLVASPCLVPLALRHKPIPQHRPMGRSPPTTTCSLGLPDQECLVASLSPVHNPYPCLYTSFTRPAPPYNSRGRATNRVSTI